MVMRRGRKQKKINKRTTKVKGSKSTRGRK
jgi:hypothetical protein